MNKNGFIATSLIYSFFLIFVTLFLTIIADYLQNKVLLNTIEKGIKDEINSTMGINDFEVGDMISFVDDCSNLDINNQWVIANINYNEKSVVFYSYDFDGITPNNFGTKTDLIETDTTTDIEFGYRNATYLNKILYTFKIETDASGNVIREYKIGENKCISIECDGNTNGVFDSGNNCINGCTTTNPKARKRLKITVLDTNYNKCTDGISGDGVIILEV